MDDAAAAASSPASSSSSSSGAGSPAPSSPRSKRRRIDRYALGFEFAPRHAPRGSPEWTEESTFALLDAWGDRFVHAGRRSLRADEWLEVSRLAAAAASRPPGYFSEAQCRNRIDTLKKKFKKEKERSRLASLHSHPSHSKWVFFDKMQSLMSPPPPTLPPPSQHPPTRRRSDPPVPPMPRLSWGVDAGEYVSAGGGEGVGGPGDSGSEAEAEELGDEETNGDRLGNGKGKGTEFAVLVESIRKFGEAYERIESNKRQQMAEVERMRKDFQRELEVRRREILEQAQAEIARISEEDGAGNEDEDEDERLEDEDEDDDDEQANHGAIDASP